MDRQQLGEMSLNEVANFKGNVTAGTANDQAANAEFMRRQVAFQEQATVAAQKEADAAERTAQYTRENARYMLWSVIALMVSSVLSAVFSFLAWQYPHH